MQQLKTLGNLAEETEQLELTIGLNISDGLASRRSAGTGPPRPKRRARA